MTRTTAAALRVEKRGYSSNPWRLVNEAGVELYEWLEYPGGQFPPYQGPVCFERKRDAVAALAAMQAKEVAAMTTKFEPCPSCHGGSVPDKKKPQHEWDVCPDCEGSGEREVTRHA